MIITIFTGFRSRKSPKCGDQRSKRSNFQYWRFSVCIEHANTDDWRQTPLSMRPMSCSKFVKPPGTKYVGQKIICRFRYTQNSEKSNILSIRYSQNQRCCEERMRNSWERRCLEVFLESWIGGVRCEKLKQINNHTSEEKYVPVDVFCCSI